MKYIIHLFREMVFMLVLFNLMMLLIPVGVRRAIRCTFRTAYHITHFIVSKLIELSKYMYANYKAYKKENEQQNLEPTQDNVTHFPKTNVK